ncbi:MAG: glycine cleavage system aminomethyltransferase GcvT [Halofilum sp. (in: g-proteobacteria)]|nr:glycine cleavage system aminomethyltransferase GcvT [Halofilum sp. (in: g-proteobacteria)]
MQAKRTALYESHRAAGARLVDFAGWQMPVNYGSQLAEHHAVRRDAGMFDVSHMNQIDLAGPGAADFLRRVFANDVGRMSDGQALYGCLLNENAGVIDDGIVYRVDDSHFRFVLNAATRDKDLAWLRDHAGDFDLELSERDDLAMIAVQGPKARERVHQVLEQELAAAAEGLKRFRFAVAGETWAARTGYTGEDGYELMLPNDDAPGVWSALVEAGVQPAGLGSRDTLRLEAGMALYGHEMDEETTPLEAGLGWTVAWEPEDRDFIGRERLAEQRERGAEVTLTGLLLSGRGIAREQQQVVTDAGDGVVTSGGFSPTLERSIALARVPLGAGAKCEVMIRNRAIEARMVDYPFVRNGKPRIDVATDGDS